MFAFAAHIGLHARVVDGHNLARDVAYLVGAEVAHRYEVPVGCGAPGEVVQQGHVLCLMLGDEECQHGPDHAHAEYHYPEFGAYAQGAVHLGCVGQVGAHLNLAVRRCAA